MNYWDLNSEKPKRVQHGHNKSITSVVFDPNTKKIYSASYDALVLQWDPSNATTQSFKGKPHSNQINKVVIQGDSLVTAAKDDTVRITPLNGLDYGASVSIPTESDALDVAASKKAKFVVVVSMDSLLVIRDGKVVTKNQLKYQPASVALSIDETHVAVGGKDNAIHLYSLSGDKLTDSDVLSQHRGVVTAVQYSPDGKFLGSCDANRDVFVWDLSTKKVICEGWQYHSARINALSWNNDSDHIATGSIDGKVIVWSRVNPKNKIEFKDAHRGGVNAVGWLDATTVISAGADCCVKTFECKF